MEPIYGLMAEFDTPTELVEAAKRSYADGYRKMDTYSPFPIEEASEAIGFHKDRVALIVLIGGILGGLSGYLLQYWINVINYPLNIGGNPVDLKLCKPENAPLGQVPFTDGAPVSAADFDATFPYLSTPLPGAGG